MPDFPAPPPIQQDPRVGILVLNYHHPVETIACIRSLLDREPPSTRIIWIENDAASTWDQSREVLEQSGIPFQLLDAEDTSLPPRGTLGVILNPGNLGFAGGNNVGLRLLHRASVPFAWVLNNDTVVAEGSSEDLVQAAVARPNIGAWGTPILTQHVPCYFGGIISKRDYGIALAKRPETLEQDPLSYVSGCSLFLRTEVAAKVGFIPEKYFLYYEDAALGLNLRKEGFQLSGIWSVVVLHIESLSAGKRSRLLEFYNRRNRWHFIRDYFPEDLPRQTRRRWYALQKALLRGLFWRVRLEHLAYRDFKAGLTGSTDRHYSANRRRTDKA